MKFAAFVVAISLLSTVGAGQVKTYKIEPDTRTVRSSSRIQLRVTVDPASAKPGAQIMARITLKNLSPRVVRLQDSFPENDFRVAVADSSNREPARTEWGEKLLRGEIPVLRNTVVDLQPGEEQQISVELTRVYKFSEPGTYYARLMRHGIWTEADEDNKRFDEVAYSAAVEIKIVE